MKLNSVQVSIATLYPNKLFSLFSNVQYKSSDAIYPYSLG